MGECSCCSADRAGTGDMVCQLPAPPAAKVIADCPVSGRRGKKVSTTTIKSMLAVSLTALRQVDYLFCDQADCPVVYFSADGAQTFTTAEVRERVFQKERATDDVFVCYCFQHTPSAIRAELLETGQSTVVERITAGIQAGQCGCDVRNPQGSCCLGNVSGVVKRLQHQLTP